MHHSPFSGFFPIEFMPSEKEKKLALANKEHITDAHRDYNTAKHWFVHSLWVDHYVWCHCLHISLIISPLSFINALVAIYCLRLPHLLFLHCNNKVAAFEERVLSLCVVYGHIFYASLSLPPQNAFFSPTLCTSFRFASSCSFCTILRFVTCPELKTQSGSVLQLKKFVSWDEISLLLVVSVPYEIDSTREKDSRGIVAPWRHQSLQWVWAEMITTRNIVLLLLSITVVAPIVLYTERLGTFKYPFGISLFFFIYWKLLINGFNLFLCLFN